MEIDTTIFQTSARLSIPSGGTDTLSLPQFECRDSIMSLAVPE
jgi:hypothetical protein